MSQSGAASFLQSEAAAAQTSNVYAGPAREQDQALREVFVSYASGDQAIADRLVRALENRHLRCWIASREIPAGVNYQSEIPGAIAACTIFLLLHSRQAAANSHEIEKEMSIARRLRKPFIPVRLDDSKPEKAFLFELATTQYIDLFPDFDAAVHRLSLQLARLCEAQDRVEQRVRSLARLRTARIWSFRAGLIAVACLGVAVAWKAAPILHALTHQQAIPAETATQEAGTTLQGTPPSAAGPARENEAARRARGFTARYYAMAGAPVTAWVQFQGASLTDPVRYFGRLMAKARLIEIQREYATRWPGRHFEVRADSMSVTCDRAAKACTVTGIDDYMLHRESRVAGMLGAERFTMQVTSVPGAPTQMTAITSTPVALRAEAADAAAP